MNNIKANACASNNLPVQRGCMDTLKIKSEALSFILAASANTHPHEFIGLLRKNEKGEISEVLVLPRSTYGKGFSSVDFHMLPLLSNSCGSVHSHPSGAPLPSRGDLLFFSHTGNDHIIVSRPYTKEGARAYGANGKQKELIIV